MYRSKKFEDLTISDDFMFGIVMRDPKYCKPFLETILNIKISRIEYPEDQKTINLSLDAKSIRLDVYVEDDFDTVYNIEMQNGHHKNLPKRTRYYQGMIDLNLLDKGMDYTQLKQSFVIFVCTFDPFHIGRHVYTFENRCVEDQNLPLNDGTQKIILNTKGIFDDVRPELKRLLNFIDGRQPEDSFTQDLSKAVESAKRNEKWRHDYMTLQMAYDEKYREGLETGIQQGIERGIEQGIEQGITTSARRMLSSGKYSDSEISEITGLSVEQIQALKNSAK